jgi:hypothetical protein
LRLINALYISGAVLSSLGLWLGADYRAIGVSMILVGTFSFLRFYFQ